MDGAIISSFSNPFGELKDFRVLMAFPGVVGRMRRGAAWCMAENLGWVQHEL